MDCRSNHARLDRSLDPRASRISGRSRKLFALAFGLSLATLLPGKAPAQEAAPDAKPLAAPSPTDSVVARLIATLMPRNHISGTGLDDNVSERALTLFLDSLDPLKLYFYQSDIDEFQRYKTQIDDMVRGGDLSLAYTIFTRFTQRVDQQVAVAQELLAGPFDFQADEAIVIDPESVAYARTPEESRDRWRRQIKFAMLDLIDEAKVKIETAEKEAKESGSDKEIPAFDAVKAKEEAVSQLQRRYSRYATRWKQTRSDDLLELFLSSVTMAYDPHSTYMAPSTLDDFQIQMRLNLDGIGAALREKDGNTVVTNVIPGGAAAKHGMLKPDDVIVSVGEGETSEMIDIVEMPLKDVVNKIRGKAGTIVRLGVKPGGVGNVETYQIVRARVELEESAARGQIIEHTLPDSPAPLKIGYINLPSFYLDMESVKQNKTDFRSSTRDVQRILQDFRSKEVDGVVLDLSKNGGGSLTEAISLTGLFIDRGPVVQVKNSDGSVQQYQDEEAGTAWDGPLVVLTSKFSASASEIFAGAIQDYRRGIVVGDPATHGKGTVQTLMDLGQQLFRNNRQNYGALKVTLQQFYLPDGESTQLEGVAADIVLPSITSKMDVSEGDLKFALEHDRVNTTRHDVYSMMPTDLIAQLRKNSATRVEADQEFTDLLRRIELYVRQKEAKTISLAEDEFMKRRRELDAQKQDEKVQLEAELDTEVIYRDNFYNREVMNITHEYIDGLRKQNVAKAK